MSFFTELRRRNVIRVAAGYIVIGWLLLQVADTLTPALHLPEWIVSAIALVLILGIIPVLLFSWAYELTPEGLKKDSEVDPISSDTSQTARKLDVITIVAVVGIAALIGWQQFNPPDNTDAAPQDLIGSDSEESSVSDVADASIAVLPFADLSPGNDQSHFSDGISEEILNVLVHIENLKVASRTSAFGFKGQESLGIPLIAERLQVRHILEGSVRKSGDKVRITAQLIDAKTDAHLWSETFDRELTTENIFAVQDEIAAAIVKQLGSMIGNPGLAPSSVKVTTESMDAYEIYLRAQGLFHVRSEGNIPEIVALYEQAVAIDPNFAEAWAGLSGAYTVVPAWNLGSRDDYFPKAQRAADRASALDDSLALPYSVRGSLISDRGDMIGGVAQMTIAVQRDPSNIQAVYIRAASFLDLGYFDRAETEFRRCLELDPNYEICRRFLSFVLLFQGDVEPANKLFEASLLHGQSSWNQVFLSYYSAIGDTRAVTLLISLMGRDDISLAKRVYRFHMDSTYRFNDFIADVHSDSQLAADASPPDYWLSLEAGARDFPADFFWNPYNPFVRRPELRDEYLRVRNMLFTELGIVDYWRMHGLPPQCRSLSADDFECD